MNDFKVLLEAVLDANSIKQSDISKIQKVIEKYHLNLTADLDKASIIAEIKKIVPQLEAELQKITGIDIKIDDDALIKAFNQVEQNIAKATREEEKFVESMAKGREQIEKTRQAEEKRQQLAQSNAINKALDDEYAKRQKIAEQANKIQLSFDNGQGASDYGNRIKEIENNLVRYGLSVDEASQKTETLRNILSGFKDTDGNFLPDDKLVAQANKLEAEFKAVKISVDEAKLSFDKFTQPVSSDKASSLIVRINSFLTKNTAITAEAKMELQSFVSQLNKGVNLGQWDKFNVRLKEIENEMRQAGRLGKTLTQSLKEGAKSFTQWTISSGVVMNVWNSVRQGIDELKDLDDILTEISKTSDLTEKQLAKLGDTAFESASKYGKTASDYLTGVQEMYRAGFDNAEEMAELSVLAQSAGDMDTNVANDYLMATNAAYKYKGSVEALNKVLDSQNYITNNAAISMQDIADATTETASVAAQYGVQIDELSALIATATANTRESGSEVGTALKSILINLQDTTSKPVKDTFDALGISMTKVVNGAEQLKTPIELIYELADAYNSLPEGDVMKANILNEIGQKRHANTLAAVLGDMESYHKMLNLYNSSSAENSAFREAQKSAENWSGTWNKVKNSWSDLLQNLANTDVIIGALNAVNGLINGLDKLGAVGTGLLGAGIFARVKNAGKCA